MSTPTPYTGPTAHDVTRIPAVLKTRRQWVLWRGVDRMDSKTGEVRLNKEPFNPHTLTHASTTDPRTWGTLEDCLAALEVALEGWEEDDPQAYRGGGIGFVFTDDDPYA